MLYFITEGNNVRIKDGDNDFRVLHNTSKCIDWTVYTDKIDLSIDEVTFDQMNPTNIYFDGLAASTSEGVVNSLKGMFSNLGSKAKVYLALITQSGTDAPVATVLENNLGDITPTYIGAGQYGFTSDGLFTGNLIKEIDPLFCFEQLVNETYRVSINTESDSLLQLNVSGDGLLSSPTWVKFSVYP